MACLSVVCDIQGADERGKKKCQDQSMILTSTRSLFLLSAAWRPKAFVLLGAVMLAGCAHRIVLPDLKPATATLIPGFRRFSEAAPRQQDGSPNPAYNLSQSDQVEFNWSASSPASGQEMLINVSKCSGNCTPCPASGVPASGQDQPLIVGVNPRISMAVLGRVNRLELHDPSNKDSGEHKIDFCDQGNFLLDPAYRHEWGEVERLLNGELKGAVQISLVPSPARRAMPGDLVRTTIEWGYVSGDPTVTNAPRPFSVAQAQSTVDFEGRALVPGLSSPTFPLMKQPVLTKAGLLREWISDLDGHAFEVTFWHGNRVFSQQPTLQSISACLSGVWAPEQIGTANAASLNREIEACLAAGMEYHSYADVSPPSTPGANNQRVRYQIEVEQHWTIVSPNGGRLEQVYFPGETLRTGIRRALRQLNGEDFPDAALQGNRKEFVIVVPRSELGPDENLPFWIRVRERAVRELQSILIAPGDTIYVTRREPREAIPQQK
jgi:hypothetical protein